MKKEENAQIINSNNSEQSSIIKVICETPTTFKLVYKFDINEIQSYQDLIIRMHEYLSPLGFDNLSIFLGDLYFIRKDKINLPDKQLLPEECNEIVKSIELHTYDSDFVNIFEIYKNNHNLEMFLLFKVKEDKISNSAKEQICIKIMKLIVDISMFLEEIGNNLQPKSFMNNIFLFKKSFDKEKIVNKIFDDIREEIEDNTKDKIVNFLFLLLEGTVLDMKFRIRRMEKALKRSKTAEMLIERIKNIKEDSSDEDDEY